MEDANCYVLTVRLLRWISWS